MTHAQGGRSTQCGRRKAPGVFEVQTLCCCFVCFPTKSKPHLVFLPFGEEARKGGVTRVDSLSVLDGSHKQTHRQTPRPDQDQDTQKHRDTDTRTHARRQARRHAGTQAGTHARTRARAHTHTQSQHVFLFFGKNQGVTVGAAVL